MKYAKIKFEDIANAPGLSVSVYTQGCPHHCPGCFNPETWNFSGGTPFTAATLQEIFKGLCTYNIQHNLCILGGEPLCPENLEFTAYLINKVLQHNPNTPVFVWSGYQLEYLLQQEQKQLKYILSHIDVLIDGPFMIDQKDVNLPYRGSRNQRVIDMKKTREKGEIVLWES